jgi:O-antigen ligase
VGIGNYGREIKPTASYREPFSAHNTFLDIASEAGILNLLIWCGILFFSFKSLFKKARHQIIFFGPAISLVIFSVHSLFETAIYSPVVLALFFIIISFSNFEQNES